MKSDRVLYCYEDDTAEEAARAMGDQEVYRLVVLDSPDSKRLTGVVTLADIGRSGGVTLSGAATREISA